MDLQEANQEAVAELYGSLIKRIKSLADDYEVDMQGLSITFNKYSDDVDFYKRYSDVEMINDILDEGLSNMNDELEILLERINSNQV